MAAAFQVRLPEAHAPPVAFQTIPNELTKKLAPVDHQCSDSRDPLPKKGHYIWVITAKKGGGKSTLILNTLMHHYRKHYRTIWLFSPTCRRDAKFDRLVKELDNDGRVFDELDEAALQNVINSIQDMNASDKDAKHLIIFDDCLHQLPKAGQASVVNRLVTTNRHLRATCIFSLQKYRSCNTLIRANMDLLSVFRNDTKAEQESIMSDLAIDADLFRRLYQFATEEPNGFLHISLIGKPRFFRKFDAILLDDHSSEVST